MTYYTMMTWIVLLVLSTHLCTTAAANREKRFIFSSDTYVPCDVCEACSCLDDPGLMMGMMKTGMKMMEMMMNFFVNTKCGEVYCTDCRRRCLQSHTSSVNGGWSGWSNWSFCSTSCGTSVQTRSRTCDNPAPSHGGKNCTGVLYETQPCYGQPCLVNGGWSNWSDWSTCSVTCGSGTHNRRRTCNNPTPLFGGNKCTGNDVETRNCSVRPCRQAGSKYCLSCSGVTKPKVCANLQICQSHSECFTDSYIDSLGVIRYNLGCRDKMKCHSRSPFGKRSVIADNKGANENDNDTVEGPVLDDTMTHNVFICQRCCSSELCNSQLCTSDVYPTSRGPLCFNCAQNVDSLNCNKITVCGRDEACHLTSSQYLGDTIYKTSCQSKYDCKMRHILDAGAFVLPGNMSSYGKPLCEKCCTTDLCNEDTCVTK